jgi:excisionase family DNA binding protein
MNKKKDYYSLKEVANMLGISHSTVMRHVRDNILQTVTIGKTTKRVTKEDLDNYIKRD